MRDYCLLLRKFSRQGINCGTRSYMNKIARVLMVLIISLLVVSCPVIAANSASDYKMSSSISLIENAFKAGQITQGDKIFFKLQAIIAPRDLPTQFKSASEEIVPCGTPIVMDVLNNWRQMTADQQQAATAYLARPSGDMIYISPEAQFAIHYDTVGYDAVPSEDLNLNGIPDYVERIGLYADSCYLYYHYDLGYLVPPSDGDAYYDIYLIKISAYGITIREHAGDSSWNDYSSYMQINNTFFDFPPNDDPEGDVIGAQKVTCAHEYFHATQMAYNALEDLWWMESSATAFEEFSFSEVNDNYNYLPSFYDYPDSSLVANSYHMYGTFVWTIFLQEKFGINTIHSIWSHCRFNSSIPAIDSALLPYSKSMESIFPEFESWNYFTGPRSDTARYDSGAYYPAAPLDRVYSSCVFAPAPAVNAPDGLSCNYIKAYPDTLPNGYLRIDFDGSNSVEWAFAYLTFQNNTRSFVDNCSVDLEGRARCGIYDFQRYDSVVFIPTVVTQWLDDNQYTFGTAFIPFGDANGSASVNAQDVTYNINFLYKHGPSPVNNYLMGDADGNGSVNILDISYLIKFLYKGGPPPCPYRP